MPVCGCAATAKTPRRGPSLGEHELGAVVPGPVGDHVDRCAAPTTRPQPHSFDDYRIVGPLVQRYRVGEQSFSRGQVPDVRNSRSPPPSGTLSNNGSLESSSGLTAINNSATSPESAIGVG
ncbi:hypothetical protein I553_4240 [Mycobacterium xenopi 4042]|uniref:Uncharacterized protein n=1 Tax=Mycobacterium xenopi 4042 TaxID=1299334 RepID=X8AGJ6_MYCXE|nr:hypothetical protein I553_4240 [Mycobacterium xenopi 4042]